MRFTILRIDKRMDGGIPSNGKVTLVVLKERVTSVYGAVLNPPIRTIFQVEYPIRGNFHHTLQLNYTPAYRMSHGFLDYHEKTDLIKIIEGLNLK